MSQPRAELIPSLLVTDLGATFAFYQSLRFQKSGVDGGQDPTWGEVSGHGVTLQFYTEPPVGTPPSPSCSGTFYIRTGDVAELAATLRGVVDFEWGPEGMEYGSLEFAVRDPDGYLIAFTEPV